MAIPHASEPRTPGGQLSTPYTPGSFYPVTRRMVTEENSFLLVQTLVLAIISSLLWEKGSFSESAFDTRQYDIETSDCEYKIFKDDEHLSDSQFNQVESDTLMVHALNSSEAGSAKILQWLDTAVWDLLKQKWLDELHLILQDDEVEERDSVIEVYKIRFGYNFDGSANVELASRDRTAIVTPGRSALHLKHSMAQIITETAELCKQSTLKAKPLVNMELVLNKEFPAAYKLPGFRGCKDPASYRIPDPAVAVSKAMDTGHHKAQVRLHTRLPVQRQTASPLIGMSLPQTPKNIQSDGIIRSSTRSTLAFDLDTPSESVLSTAGQVMTFDLDTPPESAMTIARQMLACDLDKPQGIVAPPDIIVNPIKRPSWDRSVSSSSSPAILPGSSASTMGSSFVSSVCSRRKFASIIEKVDSSTRRRRTSNAITMRSPGSSTQSTDSDDGKKQLLGEFSTGPELIPPVDFRTQSKETSGSVLSLPRPQEFSFGATQRSLECNMAASSPSTVGGSPIQLAVTNASQISSKRGSSDKISAASISVLHDQVRSFAGGRYPARGTGTQKLEPSQAPI